MSFNQVLLTLKRDLIQTFALTDEWFDRDEDLLQFAPSSGWNAMQVLEHIVLTGRYLLILIDKGSVKALRHPVTVELQEELERYELSSPALEAIGVQNSFTWERPEHMVPTGAPAKEVREELRDHLDRCLCTLELLRNGQGIRTLTSMSVNDLGKLDVYQYLYFLVLHVRRHLEQLRRIESEHKLASC